LETQILTIITVSFNSQNTIRHTLESIANQTYTNLEHIIVDGASKDNTLKIIAEFPHVAKVISEHDKGIYDAMNKGIRAASGDVIGILNSDDFYPCNTILEEIMSEFTGKVDATIGDVAFVRPNNLHKIIRYYSAKKWRLDRFEWGYMPPHPAFFLRKKFYEKYGLYQIDYKIGSDYELLIRMLYRHQLNYKYIPKQIVTMRTGGVSTESFKSRYILNKEIVRGCAENDISTNMLKLSLKYFRKVFEYLPQLKVIVLAFSKLVITFS